MNMDKTKFMFNVHVAPTVLAIGNTAVEAVDEYIYLGQVVRLGRQKDTGVETTYGKVQRGMARMAR